MPFHAIERHFGIRHIWSRSYRPCTNGKAERSIKILLRERSYGVALESSEARKATFIAWLDYYNQERALPST